MSQLEKFTMIEKYDDPLRDDTEIQSIIDVALKYYFEKQEASIESLNSVSEYSSDVIRCQKLGFWGNPLQMKVMAEAINFYLDSEGMDNTYLRDSTFQIETDYQTLYGLQQDNWGFIDGHQSNLENLPEQKQETEFKPTLDTIIKSQDQLLLGIVRNAIGGYMKDSGISKSQMEKFVTDYISFDNGFIKATGPAFQMKVVAEAIENYTNNNSITSQTLQKMNFEIQKSYRDIYEQKDYKYVSEHLHRVDKDYITYSVPMAWKEGIYVELEGSELDRLSGDTLNIPKATFFVPTVNYADIEVSTISPNIAVSEADSMAQEDPFEYIGDSEVGRVISDQDSITGELHFEDDVITVDPEANPFEENKNAFKIESHPNYKKILDKVKDMALTSRDENVTNGDFGDAHPEIYIVDEFDDTRQAVVNQVKPIPEMSFVYDITQEDISSIYDNPEFTDGAFAIGFSGKIKKFVDTDRPNAWIIYANNFEEIMTLRERITFFKIEQAFLEGNLENVYATKELPQSVYEKYVNSTGKDPLDKHPDIMESYHFPLKSRDEYAPNAIETLLNNAQKLEESILMEMNGALSEYRDKSEDVIGNIIGDILKNGDMAESQNVGDKFNYHNGKLTAITTIKTALKSSTLDQALELIFDKSKKCHDLWSFQKNQQGLSGENEVYTKFTGDIEKLKLIKSTMSTTSNKGV